MFLVYPEKLPCLISTIWTWSRYWAITEVYWSEFLASDLEITGSVPGDFIFCGKLCVWNGFTQPRDDYWAVIWMKNQRLRSRKPRLSAVGTVTLTTRHLSTRKIGINCADKRWPLSRYSSLADQKLRRFFFCFSHITSSSTSFASCHVSFAIFWCCYKEVSFSSHWRESSFHSTLFHSDGSHHSPFLFCWNCEALIVLVMSLCSPLERVRGSKQEHSPVS
jgi:hypothetical protein